MRITGTIIIIVAAITDVTTTVEDIIMAAITGHKVGFISESASSVNHLGIRAVFVPPRVP